VAVYTHVSSDHLDRHGTLEAYRAVKRRLAELLPAAGRLVVNAEDPVSSEFMAATPAPAVTYRRSEPAGGGLGVRDDWIVAEAVPTLSGGVSMSGPAGRIMPLGEVTLPGAHNTSNVLAAVAVGVIFGVAPDAIRRAVSDFRGVEHRLEDVAVIDGVRFVNDSQGTQPDAVIAALRSFDSPIVLIAGGRSKDLDLTELAAEVALRTAAVVLIGETASEMELSFGSAGARQLVRADNMEHAVRLADAIAREALATNPGAAAPGGATVLLSPAAASFDMFVDYAERGNAFKNAVRALAETAR
jgi:UDP-N-acetylmuramoylalanine--D-glutamate ligase